MTKKKVIGILWFTLILFAVSFVYSTPNSSGWGDELLRKIGIRTWSKGYEGLHYTVIVALIIVMIAYNRVIHYLKDIYPKFIKMLPLILIIFFIIYPGIYLSAHKTIQSHSKGLNAIEYYRKESNLNFYNDSNRSVKLDGQITLENLGNEIVTISIKLIPDRFFRQDFYDEEFITATKPNTDETEEFTVYPHTKQTIPVNFQVKTDKSFDNLRVNMSDLNIIIFNKDKEKAFIKY